MRQVDFCIADPECPGPTFQLEWERVGGTLGTLDFWRCSICACSAYFSTETGPRKAVPQTLDSITDYSRLANRTLASNVLDGSVVATWPKNAAMALNGGTGLCSEAGEVNEIIKKWLFHGHPMDEPTLIHLQKELGDLAWYFALVCFAFDMAPAGVLAANIAKLKARYPQGFSTERSINRAPGDI